MKQSHEAATLDYWIQSNLYGNGLLTALQVDRLIQGWQTSELLKKMKVVNVRKYLSDDKLTSTCFYLFLG